MIIKKTKDNFLVPIEHALGLTMVSSCNQFAYIPIPKNASSFLKFFFSSQLNCVKFSTIIHTQHYERKTFIFLRDPIDRWYTGIVEYFFRFGIIDIEPILEYVAKTIVFDAHTLPQVNFLENLNTDYNFTFFKVDQYLDINLVNFFVQELNFFKIEKNLVDNYKNDHDIIQYKKDIYLAKLKFNNSIKKTLLHNLPDQKTFQISKDKNYSQRDNITNSVPSKIYNLHLLKKYIQENPHYIDKIKKIYENDYKLIEHVKFYGQN